ncbi:serine/threonine-protein kinase [Acrocarpospora catenulata]|uniref:serine/threonine-protein kinase n=1 Tax=Acrocarpospora catenulata TaxID=2836182 RepID=UPI001BD97564|nr:serine/threonine-protein kinase [Acrocarpospora catenulata]
MQPTGTIPLQPEDPPELGPYRLLGRLGEGGMGTVYLGSSAEGRLVAIKVIRSGYASGSFAARFHAEVGNARRVASFCTAQVLEDGTTADGRPYMVTEYIAGTPLSEQISRHGALEPGQLHGVAIGVATALAAIHVAGLVHRDLKPANVILSMSGPRVIDFGIARALDATQGPTQAGEVVGSPGWWAPEQVSGGELGPWTDIFAWGCLVAYAGNGRHPYGMGDAGLMAARVLSGSPDLGDLPAPLDDLVRRATSRDPAQRPGAQDLMLALVGGGAATTVITPERSPTAVLPAEDAASTELADVPRPAPSRPRRWILAAVLAVLAVGVTAGVLVMVPRGGGGSAPTPSESAETAQSSEETPAESSGTAVGVGEWAEIAGSSLQVQVTEPPDCSYTNFNDTDTTQGKFCLVKWALQNTGEEGTEVGESGAALVDADGLEHGPSELSDSVPDWLEPGDPIYGTLVFDVTENVTPAAVLLADNLVQITF